MNAHALAMCSKNMSLIALSIFNCIGCLPPTQYMVQPSPTFLLFSRNSMTQFHPSLLQPYLQNHPFCQGKLIYTVVSKYHTTLQISKIMVFIACHSTRTMHVDILVGCYTECYKLSLASGDFCSLCACSLACHAESKVSHFESLPPWTFCEQPGLSTQLHVASGCLS